ncbi:MAG: FAD binding domain-containing protein [Coriobacteriales bacterium]|jgi:xanthine dehydrogenase YagS FAD-binding subunit|nr:FAD binding domain-containing protein [Coriobacteriales bacterium]
MRHFTHIDASSINEASSLIAGGSSMLIAGGTDLLGTLKDEILPQYPQQIVNLKTVDSLDYIKEDGDAIAIGALTKLDTVANDAMLLERFTALAEAAGRVSAPTQRHMGTIGGNICQMHRCWYFRAPENRFYCLRKGGDYCPATIGDNRYHSIFGAEQGCITASPHDTAPALIALNATIVTNKTQYVAEDFFAVNGIRSNVLGDDEIVTEIRIPNTDTKSAFLKHAERKAIDFPIVNCAVAVTGEGTRIACGGLFPTPLRMATAEAEVAGGISEDSAQRAGDAAVAEAQPFPKNAYKVELARALVKRTLLKSV